MPLNLLSTEQLMNLERLANSCVVRLWDQNDKKTNIAWERAFNVRQTIRSVVLERLHPESCKIVVDSL